jgi:hypothetical protein
MHAIQEILSFIGPRPFAAVEMSQARRLLLAAVAFVAAPVLAAVWGVAAGSAANHLSLMNAVSVPMLLLVSSAAALPVVAIVFRLTAAEGRVSDLVLGHAGAVFGASLVLALFAPIVALYQYSSSWAGPLVALGSALMAMAIGFALLLRGLAKLVPAGGGRRSLILPAGLLCVLQIAALLQLAAIAPPVMPHRTLLGHGVDGLVQTAEGSR